MVNNGKVLLKSMAIHWQEAHDQNARSWRRPGCSADEITGIDEAFAASQQWSRVSDMAGLKQQVQLPAQHLRCAVQL